MSQLIIKVHVPPAVAEPRAALWLGAAAAELIRASRHMVAALRAAAHFSKPAQPAMTGENTR